MLGNEAKTSCVGLHSSEIELALNFYNHNVLLYKLNNNKYTLSPTHHFFSFSMYCRRVWCCLQREVAEKAGKKQTRDCCGQDNER